MEVDSGFQAPLEAGFRGAANHNRSSCTTSMSKPTAPARAENHAGKCHPSNEAAMKGIHSESGPCEPFLQGRSMQNVAPWPWMLSTQTLPWWLSTTRRTIERPRPVLDSLPVGLAERTWNGPKTRAMSCWVRPGPWSLTLIEA